jgi:chemotaxis protein MotA
MLIIVGYLMVIGAIVGGFALSGGHLAVLFQPVEILIIVGSAFAAFMMSTGIKTMKATGAAVGRCFKGSPYNKALYMQALTLLNEIAGRARREGLLSVEADIEDPANSALFKKAPLVASDHHGMEFLVDYLRMAVAGQLDPHEMDNLMDLEIESHHQEAMQPVDALRKLADGLPAFGIVAAVLGVVHTMESVDQPPAVLGALIGAALVGTFLGILLAYGFVAPLANMLEQRVNESSKLLQVLKAGLLSFVTGSAPIVVVEYARKVIPPAERPGFTELEEHLKQAKATAA